MPNHDRDRKASIAPLSSILLAVFAGSMMGLDLANAQSATPVRSVKSPRTLPASRTKPKVVRNDETATPQKTETPEPEDEIESAPKNPISVDAKSTIRLNYGRREWNADATKLDAAVIFLREGATGRIVQIELEESAPDSAVFSGIYSISWEKLEGMRAEFYAPPQKLLADIAGRKQIASMIESKELKRLPFVLRKDPVTGAQNIELFDNPSQARTAYRAFQAEQQLLVALKNRYEDRAQTLDTAAIAAEQAEFEESSRNLAERVRMSQLETQRLAQLLQTYSNLTSEERARRQSEARKASEQAMLDYRANRFSEAKENFQKAVDLDPSSRNYYFQYGVTLYKLDDFNRALVYLDLAEAKSVNTVEREFYRGLSFYRLKDSRGALESFEKVGAAKDPLISPSARFYRGVIYFERKQWSEARTEFQAVLDESKDPALDTRAEAFLENILRQQQFDTERSKKWSLTATIGELYDDNVLVSSDSERDRGTATDNEALRTLLQGSLRYRPIYEETSEFAIQLDAMTLYSVDTSFQRAASISNADPTVVALTLPYTHKGLFLGKGHKFDIIPGIEATYMGIEGGEWKMIYQSYLASFQNLFIVSDRYLTSLNLDLRSDNSNLSTSTGDDDSTAIKSKFSWSNINFLEDKSQIIVSDLAFTLNNSKGKNSVFNRIDIGVGYVTPFFWDMTFSTKLSYFHLTYPENSTGRIDDSVTLSLGLTRKLSELLTGGFMTSYNINGSNTSANQYKRFNAMFTLTANNLF